ncbi:metallophosphoesterase family protein [Kordiimonas aestuarii]|uniref:metallophosphoesterase family protein n=1 Tax=Kordiimonas aestuarii TaxID=1005925 RepID=UPI0021D24A78|nr:metallophosphoesterase family protein [Kordiimonas aestuarii]
MNPAPHAAGGAAPEPVRRDWRLPEDVLVYAIGDIHGRLDLLEQLLEKIEADRAAQWGVWDAYVVFLGDYVDRGFQSREVIEYLLAFRPAGVTPIFLRGNHEDLLLRFIDDPMMAEVWLNVGGVATMSSYGVDIQAPDIAGDILAASDGFSKAFPARHRAFLEGLPVNWQKGDYFFVHAGLRPGVPLAQQRPRDMTTIRQDFTLTNHDFGVCVVHGHTGVRNPEHNGNRIAVDTGAFATGVLTAVALQDEDVRFISTT